MSRRAVLLLAILVAIVGIVALPSAAGLSDDGGQAADVEVTGPSAQTTDCSSCHQEGSAPAAGPDNVDTCKSCHTETTNQFEQSAHYGEDSHADITCTACHEAPDGSWFNHFRVGPHGDENPSTSLAPEDTCAVDGCHGYGSQSLIPDGKSSGVTHVNPYHPEYGEWNETEDANWDPASMESHSEVTEDYAREQSCLSCKSTQGAINNLAAPGIYDYNEDAQPTPENVTEWRITCVACHDPHTVKDGDVLRGDFEDSSELCAQCHNTEISHEFTREVQTEHGEVHHSQWEMYRNSKYADNSSSHPQLECASCHMPMRDQQYDADHNVIAPQISGHDFEVNTTMLDSDQLMIEDYRKCSNCHQDLEATISEQNRITQSLAEVAADMRDSSNATVYEYGYQNDTELVDQWKQARFWVSFVEHGGSPIHNPEMVNDQMGKAIANFSEVQQLAYEQRVTDLQDQLDKASQEPQTTNGGDGTGTTTPGMGIGVSIVAVLGAALLAVRRWT